MTQHPHNNNDERDDERNHDADQHSDRDREDREPDALEAADLEELCTLGEVADLLRVSPATLRYWRYEHTGPRSFRIGRHVRYRRTDVLTWITRQIDNGSGDPA